MSKSLLITREEVELGRLVEFCCAQKIRLTAQSFIRFEAIPASIPREMEVLFLGSQRAAAFFMQQGTIPESCQIACIGEATKLHLEKMGLKVHFFGSVAGHPETVAAELKTWLSGRQLHIALSDISNRSMAKLLPPEQVTEILVYKTIPTAFPLVIIPDVIAFSSPSNVNGFLLENEIQPTTLLIAWGTATAQTLKQLGYEVQFILKNATEEELIQILNSI